MSNAASVFPITMFKTHTEEVILLTRVTKFQQIVQTNYMWKIHTHKQNTRNKPKISFNSNSIRKSQTRFSSFSQPSSVKQGHCSAHTFLMFGHYPLHKHPFILPMFSMIVFMIDTLSAPTLFFCL